MAYIEREAAIDAVCRASCSIKDRRVGICKDCPEAREIMRIPVANVVSVVRCKDCYWYRRFYDSELDCRNPDGMRDVTPNDFCSCGKRKDGDT